MASLLDIAAVTEKVTIGKVQIEVTGVSAAGVALLMGRFPEIKDLMAQRAVPADRWAAIGGEALAAILAAGTGHPGDVAMEAAAAKLPLEAQADLLNAILRVTMPRGVGPFVETITALLGGLDGAPLPKAPGSSSPKPSKR